MATVLVTGASRGIGLALARRAAARGDTVIACARDPEAADLAGLDGVRREPVDVADPETCAALARRLEGETIDLLICNAGVYVGRGRIDDAAFAPEDWAGTFAVNVAGVFHTVRALRPLMRRPGGRIAVISSRMGSNAEAGGGSYIYRASKAAATNLATNLALDLKPEGIAVASYHPGWVRTDMGGDAADISVGESAAGLLTRFDALDLETSGVFEAWDGRRIPF
ncbi:MAG: SDR family oxidoreductase [Paracoccaceae bacterium]